MQCFKNDILQECAQRVTLENRRAGLVKGNLNNWVPLLLRVQLCDPMDRSMPGFPVLHWFPEFAQIHAHWVGNAIQPS